MPITNITIEVYWLCVKINRNQCNDRLCGLSARISSSKNRRTG